MIGILIVTHCHLADEFILATEMVAGELEQISGISIDPKGSVEELRAQVAKGIKEVDTGDGVLILTDMFGGTPSNICLSLLEEGKVEVLSGINLPMLIKVCTSRENKELRELAGLIMKYGQKNISLASEILKKREKNKKQ